jgi:hypothetical protein
MFIRLFKKNKNKKNYIWESVNRIFEKRFKRLRVKRLL